MPAGVVYIPEIILEAYVNRFETRFTAPPHRVFRRRLRPSDPSLCIGVVVANYIYQATSAQIGQEEPTVGTYTVYVQNMVKHADEEKARQIHNVQNALLRAILYRDQELRVRLLGANETIEGSRESVKRSRLIRQDFLSNQVSGNHIYLCATEIQVETEITLL